LARVADCLGLVIAAAMAGCHGAGATAPTQPSGEMEIRGVDTQEFTPRERHELSGYVTEFTSPCPSVAVPIAQCLSENRPCPACLPAAQAIAKAVRDGMTHEQVEHLYKERFDVASVRTIPLEGSPSRGPEAAPVVVVEFADFECPYCQKIAPELDSLWSARKDAVRFVYKFLPLTMHPHGEIAARAAVAAQLQGKFWEMHHQLFANGQRLEERDIEGYAEAIGLDIERFRADMGGDLAKTRIAQDRNLADALGVKGTPALFIDGREYDSKVDIATWLDGEIAASGGPHPGVARPDRGDAGDSEGRR
jgi:predicted DsbA family dithiol-disulfide isomerase